jgi:dihydroorotate dehydrogenase
MCLSCAPIKQKSDACLAYLYKNCKRDLILMGVGGIETGVDIYRKIRLGAHLCQLYTGWIYGGPHMIPEALSDLAALMVRDGAKSLAEIRGIDAQ